MRQNLLLVAAAALLGCDPDFNSTIEDHVRMTGLAYRACGEIQAGQCSSWRPDAQAAAALECLSQAYGACAPARLVETYPTVEGDPIREAVFVEVRDSEGRCRLTSITDTTADRFGPQTIEQRTCLELATLGACEVIKPSQCATP